MGWKKLKKDMPDVSEHPEIDQPVKWGWIILSVFLGGFLLWSLLFHLDTGAIANGRFIILGERKVVQHLEGGIVKQINIEEGQKVEAGEVLLQLEDTQIRASLDLYQGQLWEYLATESRIFAELNNDPTIDFPDELVNAENQPAVKKVMESEQRLFVANNNSYEGQKNVLNQRIAQYKKQIESYQAQVKSNIAQLDLMNQELEAVKYLSDRKLIDKPRLYKLQRNAAKLLGDKDEYLGMIAKTEQGIGETEYQIYSLTADRRKALLEKLNDVQEKLNDLREKVKASTDVLRRTTIRSPKAGIVLNLKANTIGGVIKPGEDICDIVPSDYQLILQVQVSPIDIDVVKPGLAAKIRLTAYKQRIVPTFDGVVSEVSADIQEEQTTQRLYYNVRIQFTPEAFAVLNKMNHVKLYPGMPAEAVIIVDHETAFSYLIAPLVDNFNRAFHEK
ncbi:HlyD family type I secretion periplasmic adaptor subunit [Legionella shakespearei]|uniref:Membrane fusion protein (MFP) family protein n=1 Tax=Legionella shakespearei DSM 23087 TaxID=1122169 RepID=A0A0W0YKV5_9GAMM|nr:HlyD family type I secretion periplasmic adaptor subunit [Legionella shakespearei]KTD57235.1 secretion system protein D [Legionella shakespearei DSM 23087]